MRPKIPVKFTSTESPGHSAIDDSSNKAENGLVVTKIATLDSIISPAFHTRQHGFPCVISHPVSLKIYINQSTLYEPDVA
jgi:hypothetical protein